MSGYVGEPRNPFECPACHKLYSTSRGYCSPARMPACNHTMCVGCVKEKRIVDEKKTLAGHPYTVNCRTCAKLNHVEEEPKLMVCLIEMIEELALHYNTEELAAKMNISEMTSFKCPRCSTAYENTGDYHQFLLYCGHSMCARCVENNQTKSADKVRPNTIKCSICAVSTNFEKVTLSKMAEIRTYLDRVKFNSRVRSEFVNNLQKIISTVVCWDCKKVVPLEESIACDCQPGNSEYVVPLEESIACDCQPGNSEYVVPLEESIACDCQPGNSEYVICLFCATVKHKPHGTTSFLRIHLEQQSEKLVKKAESSVVHSSSLITAKMQGHHNAVNDFRKTLKAKGKLAESKDTKLDVNKVLRQVDEITRQFTATMQNVVDELGKAEAKMKSDLLKMKRTQ